MKLEGQKIVCRREDLIKCYKKLIEQTSKTEQFPSAEMLKYRIEKYFTSVLSQWKELDSSNEDSSRQSVRYVKYICINGGTKRQTKRKTNKNHRANKKDTLGEYF